MNLSILSGEEEIGRLGGRTALARLYIDPLVESYMSSESVLAGTS
jgi:hypothetical protein